MTMISKCTRRAVLYLIPWIAIPLTAATAMAAPEPCSILTTAEVEQVVGKLKARRGPIRNNAAWCNYEFANGKDAMGLPGRWH